MPRADVPLRTRSRGLPAPGLCRHDPGLHNPAMERAPSEAWFGHRRPWLWLGAAFGLCAAVACGSWWFALHSARSAVRAELDRLGPPVSLTAGIAQAPEPDALARWIEALERNPPDAFYEAQWPDIALETAPYPNTPIPGVGFLAPPRSALEARFAVTGGAPADCSTASPESHPGGVEGWLAEHVGRPVPAAADGDCLRALLRERTGSEALRAHALAARGLARAEGAAWLARMEFADEPLPQPALHPLPAVVRHLGVLATLAALEQDPARASEALAASYALCDSLAGLPWHDAFITWIDCELMALNATMAVLAHAPDAVDAERLVPHLDGLDALGRQVAACELQRTLCNRSYARMLAGKPCGLDAFDLAPELPGASAPLLERERADALASWRLCSEWTREPLATRGAPPPYERHPLASDEFATAWLGATRPVSTDVLTRLEDSVHLLRVALIARQAGAEAARAEANRRASSILGRTIEVREEADGLVLEVRPAVMGSPAVETLLVCLPKRT